MKDALVTAFTAFGMSADSYSISEDNHDLTPRENVRRWERLDKEIFFTRDICGHPDLTEFAAYCIAADVKNGGHLKAQLSRYGIGLSSLAAPLFSQLSANSPHYCLIFVGTCLPATILAINPCDITGRIFNAIDNRIATTAFTLACKKLVTERKFQILATYSAFAKLIKHAPVESDDQYKIIEQSLKEKECSIEAIIRANSVETTIFDSSQLPARKVASVFYPPVAQK